MHTYIHTYIHTCVSVCACVYYKEKIHFFWGKGICILHEKKHLFFTLIWCFFTASGSLHSADDGPGGGFDCSASSTSTSIVTSSNSIISSFGISLIAQSLLYGSSEPLQPLRSLSDNLCNYFSISSVVSSHVDLRGVELPRRVADTWLYSMLDGYWRAIIILIISFIFTGGGREAGRVVDFRTLTHLTLEIYFCTLEMYFCTQSKSSEKNI